MINTTIQDFIFAVFSYLLEEAILIGTFFFLLPCRFKNKLAAYSICVVGHLVLSVGLKVLFKEQVVIRTFFTYTGFVVLVCFFFLGSIWRRLAVGCTLLSIVSVAEMLAMKLLELVNPLNYSEILDFTGAFRIGVVFVNILLFTGAMYFLVFWRILVDKKKMTSWILYLIIPTYQLILLLMYYSACQKYTIEVAFLGMGITVMGVVIDLLLMYFMNGMEQKLEIEERLSVLYQQRQYELDYYQMTNHHIEEMRTVRHDFKNQIQTAYIMMEQGKSREKIEQLLGETSQWLEQSGMKGYCTNPVANALMTVKAAKALEQGILLEANCTVPEDLGTIEEIDLCSLLGNLLDNALEACEKIVNGRERRIWVKAQCKGNYQIFRVENNYEGVPRIEKGELKTTKNIPQNHGYGLKMIERICRKYNGKMDIKMENQRFCVIVWLEVRKING